MSLLTGQPSWAARILFGTGRQGRLLLHRLPLISSSNVPDQWYESAFHGNGALGLMVYWNDTIKVLHHVLIICVTQQSLRLELGRTDVYDDREPGENYTVGNFAIDRPRLPIGFFSLITVGDVLQGNMRLCLYDGVTTGQLQTTAGNISFRAFTSTRSFI